MSGFSFHPSSITGWARPIWVLLLALAVGACDETKSDLEVWSPADHDNQANPSAGQVDTSKPRPGMPDLEKLGVNDVVLAAWKQNCVTCHGLTGQGDGPQAKMVQAPNLADPRWQRVAIDSEIAYVIKKGRGQMPAFGHLPDETVEGLVRLVRLMNPERPEDEPGTPSDEAATQSEGAEPATPAGPEADAPKGSEEG